MSTEWLVDKSAYARLSVARDPVEWATRIERGLLRVAVATVLEVGYSARSGGDWTSAITLPPMAMMRREHATPRAESRAVEVQGILAHRGHHRGPGIPDLLIAAIAEQAGLTVLHLDKDFELIAEITGQPLERLELSTD